MKVVSADALTKTYRSKVKAVGLKASFKALAKSEFREVKAVNAISFSVDRGERLAFIGPNGAGKSTTIKMLTGILSPTSGDLGVLGLNPARERRQLSRRIGTVFGQKSQLWFHLPPADSFELLGAIYEVPAPELKKRTDELKERFQLGEFFNTPVRRLSLGQRIRCEVAASMLHEPEILFLDEPTIGLDVVVKQELRERILEMNREKGVTVFLTSHDAGDIEKLCQRAIVIDKGDIVLDETMRELQKKHLTAKSITVRYSDEIAFDAPEWAETINRTRHSLTLSFDANNKSVDEAMRELIARGQVSDITVEDPSMEKIIASIFTGGERA